MARGDHIKVRRFKGLYSHHGIDLGDGTVVHFSGEPLSLKEAIVCRTSMEEFLCGGKATVVEHPATALEADEAVEQAMSYLGCRGYDLWKNNCEHFAFFCKTGSRRSRQIERAAKGAAAIVAGAALAGSTAVVALAGHHLSTRRHMSRLRQQQEYR